jgi:acetyl-CoA synthetase/medium-chain acyl-CoA synthetase
MPLLRRRAKADDVPRAGPFPPGWDVPARFNFTRDVVDALATDPLRQALTFVDREGIVDRRTFADLSGDAARWAHLLRTRLDRGDRVLIAVGKVPAWHGAMLGALKSGLVAVPCPDMLRARDLAFRVRDSGARLVVADRSLELEVEEMRQQVGATVSVVYLDEALDELRRYMPIAPTEDTTAGETAFILYTSGTTKDPKGVIHTHAYTWAQRAQATHWLDAHEGDVVWCTAGTGWAKAIWNVLLGPWSHGAEVVLHEGAFDPEERLSLLQRLGVTVLCQAPTEYRMLAKLETLGAAHLPRLRHAVSAGEPLNPEVIARFQDALGLTVHDGYGQTENSLLVANMPGAPIRPGSMGLPTPGHDVAVIDDTGHVCAAGVEGDLALIGRPPTLFTGYWGAPDETEGAFRDGWYVTGDRAVRDEDGYLWFVGRADDVIVSAAYRIGPFEVESALLEHPAVAESAVVGVPDLDRGEIVKAFVVLRPGHEPSEKLMGELQDHVKSVTAPYKYPRAVAFVEELPKTVSGKIRRSELRARGDELAIATVPTLSIVPEPVETDEAAELAEAEAARRSAEEAAERARAEAEAAERARIEAEAAARAKAEAEAAERARAEAEAAERARLEAEAAERARIEAEAAERVRIEAEEAARREAEEAARIEAEAAERARLETEAAERAGIEAEAAEQARLEAEAAERARIEAEAAEQARLEAEAAERARLEAEEAARLEAEEAARREAEEAARLEAEAAERARLEAEEAARLEAEEAARLEAEAADRARAEAAAAELAEPELLEDLEDEEALGTAAVAVDERGESRAEARRRRREEKAAAKRRAEDERRQAKAEAEQRKRDEAAAHEAAKLRAEEEKQAAKQRAEDERRRAADEKEAAKRRAEEERHQAKLDAEQRKRQEAAAREAAHSREAAEQAAAKQQAEEERRRQAEEREAAKLQQEEERRRQREEAKARRGGGLGRLFKREEHDEFDDEEDDTPVEPIPDIVERLRFYSRESQAAVTEGSGSGEQPEEPVGDDQPPASRTADSE